MNEILSTPRLVLRRFEFSDLAELHRISSHPEVAQFLWDNQPPSVERIEEVLRSLIDDYSTHGISSFAMCLKTTSALIGHCGLRHYGESGEVELIYALDRAFWRQGLIIEAARCVLSHGFDILQLDSIVGMANVDNIASWRVLEKLGMSYEKEFVLQGENLKFYRINKPS